MRCYYYQGVAVVLINYNKDPAPKDSPACGECAAKAKRNWDWLYAEKPIVEPTRFALLEID